MILDRLLRMGRGTIERSMGRARPSDSAAGNGGIDDAFLGRLRRVALVSQRKHTSGLTGEHPSPRRGSALEFADYRSYSPGDDFRQVDWNAYLRLDHLFVKLADAPERITLNLLLDTSRSMAWGDPEKFAYARRVALGLAYVALSHMDAADLLALSGRECVRLSRQESPRGLASMVHALKGASPAGSTDLDAALGGFANMRNHRGVVVVISDLLSPPGFQAGLERLSRASVRLVVVHVLSPEELNPTLEGDLELEDVETGDTVQVTVDWGTLNRYRRWLKEWLDEVESFCSRRGITYIRVETSYPIEQLLLDRLRREKVLR